VEYQKRWRLVVAADDATHHLNTPTFTFVRSERFNSSPWFTATDDVLDLLIEHIKKNGGRIEEAAFYVPFSNGCELGIHGKDAMKSDLAYVTTSRQFRETFGISLTDLANPKRDLDEILELVRGARRM